MAGGRGISSCGLCHRSSTLDDQVNVPALSSRPWAHLRRSWGGHMFYRCCFILSLSTVILCIYIYNFHRRLIRFPSNLHVTGFSSCRITQMIHSNLVWFLWWFRHGAIGPIEATQLGSMSTDLNSELTHFNLVPVIRLSKVQQLALRLCTILRSPAVPAVPMNLAECFSSSVIPCQTSRKPLFRSSFCNHIATFHDTCFRQVHVLQVWSFSFDGCLVRSNILCT